MPYTLAHPATVLFLGRGGWRRSAGPLGVPLAAAVAGSLAPDIPYYLTSPRLATSTHSFVGLFTVDLLIGLALYFVWVELILGPALWLAPAAVQRRVPERCRIPLTTRLSSPRALLVIVLCVLFGSATHLVWDSFTHSGMWATTRFPALNAIVSGHNVYTWLQFTNSILGAAVILRAIFLWWSRTPPTAAPVPGRMIWRVCTALCLIALPLWHSLQAYRRTIGVPFGWSWVTNPGRQPATIQALISGTTLGLTLIMIFALLWHIESHTRRNRDRSRGQQPPRGGGGQSSATVCDQREPALPRTIH